MMAGTAASSGSWRTGFVLGDIWLKANSAKANMFFGSLKPKKALKITTSAGGACLYDTKRKRAKT